MTPPRQLSAAEAARDYQDQLALLKKQEAAYRKQLASDKSASARPVATTTGER